VAFVEVGIDSCLEAQEGSVQLAGKELAVGPQLYVGDSVHDYPVDRYVAAQCKGVMGLPAQVTPQLRDPSTAFLEPESSSSS
jgi:hypothetical protein